jgi:putative transposase
VAITLEACHAREVIDAAFARYGTPDIVNTDQGSQFTAETFTAYSGERDRSFRSNVTAAHEMVLRG